jgi:hypothetical protein
MASEQRYQRYGSNISQARVDEIRSALHESRHVDQWANGTMLGGPAAFGVSYILDGTLFPSARNHFERRANLSDGGYPAVPDNSPAPRWPDTIAIALLLVLILCPGIRLAFRRLFTGGSQAVAHAGQRRPIQTKGRIMPRD